MLSACPSAPLLPSRDISVLRAAHGTWEAAVGPKDGPNVSTSTCTLLAAEGKTGPQMLGVGAPAQPVEAPGYAECATKMWAMPAQSRFGDREPAAGLRDGPHRLFHAHDAMGTAEGQPAARLRRTGQ